MTEGLAPFTAEELHAEVLGLEPRTAVFDCDGTLWAVDAGYGFMRWTLEQGLLSADRVAWMEARYRLYERGDVDEATICGEMVQVYAGLPVEQVRAAAALYFKKYVAPQIFPAVLSLVRALQASGAAVWAVSSTSRWVIEAGVWGSGSSVFGIAPQRILAAEVGEEDGRATDRLLAVPTGEAKAQALRLAGIPHPDVVFGNSVHDEAMLAAAVRAFPVNASEALRGSAARRGWRTFAPVVVSGYC